MLADSSLWLSVLTYVTLHVCTQQISAEVWAPVTNLIALDMIWQNQTDLQFNLDFNTKVLWLYLNLSLLTWKYLILSPQAQRLTGRMFKKCATNPFISFHFLNQLMLTLFIPGKLTLNSQDPHYFDQSDSNQSNCQKEPWKTYITLCYITVSKELDFMKSESDEMINQCTPIKGKFSN